MQSMRQKNPEESASLWSKLTFWYMGDLLYKGYKEPLQMDSLYELSNGDQSCKLAVKFEAICARYNQESKPSLLRVLVAFLGSYFWLSGIWKLLWDGLRFVSPLVVNHLLLFLENKDEPLYVGCFYTLILFVSEVVSSICLHRYYHCGWRCAVHARSALIVAVYKKSLVLSVTAKQRTTAGEIVNLMSVDANRLSQILPYLHQLWSSPIQFLVAVIALYQLLDWSVLVGIGSLCIFIPMNVWLVRQSERFMEQLMSLKDKRIRLLNETLQAMRTVKFFAWERSFHSRICEIREKELKKLRRVRVFESLTDFFWYGTPVIITAVTFFVYTLAGNALRMNLIFTALVLFNILKNPMYTVPWLIGTLVAVRVSLRRISAFLLSEEFPFHFHTFSNSLTNIEEVTYAWNPVGQSSESTNGVIGGGEKESGPLSTSDIRRPLLNDSDPGEDFELPRTILQEHTDDENNHSVDVSEELQNAPTNESVSVTVAKVDRGAEGPLTDDSTQQIALFIKDGNFTWSNMSTEPQLKNITMHAKRGELIVVIGEVGAGKSSLLAALLHEMRQISGEVYLHPSVAYAAQTPWIINATLTENITMGLPFEPQRFQTVIECCCLRPDLEILPGGRHCQIGEKGVSLSGGQKARISLARCLYRDAEVYLLDDPLSALDINVARQVFKHTILERLKEKTRILVTHHPYCLFHADRVIIMKNGSIVQQGTYTQLTAAGINVVSFLERCENEHLKDKQKRKENDKVTSEKDRCVDSDSNSDQSVSNGNEIKLIQDEERNTGRVNFTIYKSYFSKMGMIPFFSVVIFGICVQTSYILKDWWLGYWSSQRTGATGEQSFIPLSEFLMTYVAIALFGAATLLLQEIIFSLASVRAAKIIHFLMLDSVFRAPIRFFETTPVGRILNRFSKDQEAVDTVIPQTLLDLFMAAITVGSVLVLLCIATPLFTIFVIPLGILYHLIQNYYVKTSRELQRLDAVSSSPIYSHCAETLNGLPTIRAFRLQPHFVREIERRVDQNAKAFFLLNECNRWLGQRLEFCGTCVVCLTAFFAVICRNWMTDATMVGLALAYAGSITESLTWLVRYVTTTENQMNSVERMEYYIQNLEREAPAHIPECDPPNDWPQHGAIEFKNLVMKYRDDLEPALKGISFKINAGENVGICGRTGAGKSSVMYSLFRLQEATEGQILIDGIDISKIGLEPLRSNLIIIPQDPILFSGTVRSNLDPFNQYTDDELWRVLERVHMKDKIQSLPQKLYTVVAENGDNFSVGEKQLLCLGRALCRKTKIILMDEATAAIDLKTEQFIQQTIRDEFKKCTVITIAHRLNTIIENDKIIVMDNGRVLEMGTPKELLDNANSYFSAMVSKTGMETFFRQLVNAKTQLSQCQQQTPLQS